MNLQTSTSSSHKLHPQFLSYTFSPFNALYQPRSLTTNEPEHEQFQTDDESQEQIIIPMNYSIQTLQIPQPNRPGQYRTIRMISRQTPILKPIPKSTINQLPKIQNVQQCSICQESNGKGVQLKCKHHFHQHCIDPWFQISNTCPTCRNNVQ